MMRFLLATLLCLGFASASFAQDSVVLRPNPVQMWRELTEQKRQSIIDAWLQLNEVTRPPFPVYRDAILEKWGQKKLNKK